MDAKATGALIAGRRRELGLSQAELAERLHVTDKAVSRWETGRVLTAEELPQTAGALHQLSTCRLRRNCPKRQVDSWWRA